MSNLKSLTKFINKNLSNITNLRITYVFTLGCGPNSCALHASIQEQNLQYFSFSIETNYANYLHLRAVVYVTKNDHSNNRTLPWVTLIPVLVQYPLAFCCFITQLQLHLIFMDPCIVDDSVEIPTRCSFVIDLLFQSLLNAQHVSGGTQLIIRSSKMCLQSLVYIPMWWPAVATWVYKPEAANTV